jgi:hypothetical protein
MSFCDNAFVGVCICHPGHPRRHICDFLSACHVFVFSKYGIAGSRCFSAPFGVVRVDRLAVGLPIDL